MEKILLLETGETFYGEAFGATKEVIGEVVFSTGMTGYQESLTDQSYNGQMLTFTFPLIGNYGVNADDFESVDPTVKAIICREVARFPSNWRSKMSLDEFLVEYDIPCIKHIDTRQLTKTIRSHGTMKASLLNEGTDIEAALATLRATDLPTNQVAQVSTKTRYVNPNAGKNVVVVDFGLKHSILRELNKRECNVTVVPYDTTAQEILRLAPDGVMLTNGPGDPTSIPEALDMINEIQGKIPLFGICLGHQLLCLANGGETFKMKFGHRGFNHPVREIATGRIDFTSQNHGYAVDADSLVHTDLEITHIEINDETVEGVRHKTLPAFSVQYHPDAAPGPHDADHLFDRFIELMDNNKNLEGTV